MKLQLVKFYGQTLIQAHKHTNSAWFEAPSIVLNFEFKEIPTI